MLHMMNASHVCTRVGVCAPLDDGLPVTVTQPHHGDDTPGTMPCHAML